MKREKGQIVRGHAGRAMECMIEIHNRIRSASLRQGWPVVHMTTAELVEMADLASEAQILFASAIAAAGRKTK